MAIQTVQAVINGQTYNLSYNSTSGKWEATVTAPNTTSYNVNAGHYYSVSITAINTAGTSVTKDDTDATLGNNLKLYVKEKTKPTVTITAPSSGAKLIVGKPTVTVQLRDEVSGSGINIGSLALVIDGGASIGNGAVGMTATPVTNGYDISYACQSTLADGSHTINITIADNDGNTQTASSTFAVDTVPPSLNVTSPATNFTTNSTSLTVEGTVSEVTSNPVVVAITRNGVDQGAVSINAGSFSKAILLSEGTNTIVITATDTSGLQSQVTRTITYDSSAPAITAVSISPNPVDSGQTFTIQVTITG